MKYVCVVEAATKFCSTLQQPGRDSEQNKCPATQYSLVKLDAHAGPKIGLETPIIRYTVTRACQLYPAPQTLDAA
jgi:hypothetical protein